MDRTRRAPIATAGRAGLVPTSPNVAPAAAARATAVTPRGARAATTYSLVMADIRTGYVPPGRKVKRWKRTMPPVAEKSGTSAGVTSVRAGAGGASISEHQLQRQVADYLDRALPPDAFWTSIDSAGRGAIAGARMKRRGVRKGILDTLVVWRDITLWIELKSADGRLTPDQRRFCLAVEQAGHRTRICRSLEAVYQVLLNNGIPLRARLV